MQQLQAFADWFEAGHGVSPLKLPVYEIMPVGRCGEGVFLQRQRQHNRRDEVASGVASAKFMLLLCDTRRHTGTTAHQFHCQGLRLGDRERFFLYFLPMVDAVTNPFEGFEGCNIAILDLAPPQNGTPHKSLREILGSLLSINVERCRGLRNPIRKYVKAFYGATVVKCLESLMRVNLNDKVEV
jgi:hypothetical protein